MLTRISVMAMVATGVSAPSSDPITPRPLPVAAQSIPPAAHPRIIALGEASHGNEAMLRERNRLLLDLARQGRIGLVAMETGYAEARLLDRYVRGGDGDVADIVRRGFTSGFGNLAGNRTLLADLRTLNLTRPADRRVGIVGIDLSLGGPLDSAPTLAPVDCALEGVADPAKREALRNAFVAALKPSLTNALVSEADRATVHRLADELGAALDKQASDEARACAHIVAQGAAVLDAIPRNISPGAIPTDAWQSISLRDAAMAENAARALDRAQGKDVLLFAHSVHVMRVPMRGGHLSSQTRPPVSMGARLAAQLGDRYLAIAQIEPVHGPIDTAAPDLVVAAQLGCSEACLVPAETLPVARGAAFSIGINGDDREVVDPRAAASYLLLLPQ